MPKEIRYFTKDKNGINLKSNSVFVDGRWRNSRIIEEALINALPQHVEFQIRANNQPETGLISIKEAKLWLE